MIYKILKKILCEELEFYVEKSSENELKIETPFTYNDNEIVCFWIVRKNDEYKITDKGLVYEKLFDYLMSFYDIELRKQKKEKCINQLRHFSRKYKCAFNLENYEFIRMFNMSDEKYLKFLILDFANFLQRVETFMDVYLNYSNEKHFHINIHIDIRSNINDQKLKILNNLIENVIDKNGLKYEKHKFFEIKVSKKVVLKKSAKK